MKLHTLYNKHEQHARREVQQEFARRVRDLIRAAHREGLDDDTIAAELQSIVDMTQLGEALESKPVDASRIARALVQIARGRGEINSADFAKKLADTLHKRVLTAIDAYENESTWVG